MSFKPEQIGRTPYLPDRIADQIKQEINENHLGPGERLPTEQFLAETYGVSRNVVREAIARLRNEGIVESRQGIGAFVALRPRPILRLGNNNSLNSLARHQSLFELRASLEVRAAELAAMRRSEAHMEEIQSAYDNMVKTMSWGKDSVEYDIAFHRTIAAATGNPFMLDTISFIAEHLRESIELTRAFSSIDEVNAVTTEEHAAILDALRKKDPVAARQAMNAHLTNAAARIGIHQEL
ncbi:FadR/GntR family transcriptional regulator [Mesorhizobium sp. KR9-304]|uniref:FadR/GntR family transcriptional regulator n=1 Tax=Mesorhizobium sp. KR9-304 TaxID=3156614 RepID=UPI0032B458EF